MEPASKVAPPSIIESHSRNPRVLPGTCLFLPSPRPAHITSKTGLQNPPPSLLTQGSTVAHPDPLEQRMCCPSQQPPASHPLPSEPHPRTCASQSSPHQRLTDRSLKTLSFHPARLSTLTFGDMEVPSACVPAGLPPLHSPAAFPALAWESIPHKLPAHPIPVCFLRYAPAMHGGCVGVHLRSCPSRVHIGVRGCLGGSDG